MQKSWAFGFGIGVFIVGAIGFYWIFTAANQPAPAGDLKGKPKLVVLVVFDQMRGDYIDKWKPLFGDGGFKRLQSEGAWYTNCHYPYAYTLTAAGHTSLVTGTSPYKHGVIANEWWDRIHGENVQSTSPPPEERERMIAGPFRRKSESVGDSLLNTLMGKARVASISIKERTAILMAALRAQLCYWFDTGNGRFRTSPYYRPDPHSWVNAFNKGKPADRWLGKNWDRYKPDPDWYVKHSGPDDFPTEGTGYLQGQTFPHPFQYAKTKKEKDDVQNYYDAVTNSPMGSELLLEFAKAMIDAEKLGQSDSVDLLCISFTSNDYIGHTWGPDSQEVLDITLRSDALMKELLDTLDSKVGKGNYYLAMSADHGVAPLVEFAKKQSKTAERVDPDLLAKKANDFLNKAYFFLGDVTWLEELKRPTAWIYLNQKTLALTKVPQEELETVLAAWYELQPGVEKAFTRTEMLKGAKEPSRLYEMVKRSFHPDCSGDVMVILKPYHMFSPPNLSENPEKNSSYRATHGTPHPYDTHVPLLVMGPRIQPGVRNDPIVPQTMAAILAEALGVPRPKDAEYPVPDGLFKK